MKNSILGGLRLDQKVSKGFRKWLKDKLVNLVKMVMQIFAESAESAKSAKSIFAIFATFASAIFVGKGSNESTVISLVKSRIGSTMARQWLENGSTKLHKNLGRVVALLCLLLMIGVGDAWATTARITTKEGITSGQTYWIGATTSSTDYYLSVNGSSTSTSIAGTAQSSLANGTIFVFSGSGTDWTIKFNDYSNYLGIKNGKDNGKLQVVSSAATFKASNQSGKLRLSHATAAYSIQKNNSTTNFGSYGNTQTDIWLEPALKVTYNGNGNTSGSVPTDANYYLYNTSVTAKTNSGTLAKTGYTFAGWNTKDDGTGSDVAVSGTFSITANTTLYAKWTPSGGGSTPTLTLTGSGAFGTVNVGGTKDLNFTLTGSNLSANATVSVTGTGFSLVTPAGGTLTQTAGSITGSNNITVRFTPTGKGSHAGTLTVTSTGATDATVSLSGTGQLVDTYVDMMHSNSDKTGAGDGYTIPTLSNTTPSSGCVGSHAYFAGWSASAGSTTIAKTAGGSADATGATYYAVWGDGVPGYQIVTDEDDLSVNDIVTFASMAGNSVTGAVIKAYNDGNNWPQVGSVTTSATGTIAANTTNLQSFTLKAGTVDDTWAFYDGTGYVYAANASNGTKNYMKRQASLDAAGSFSISIDGSNVATMLSQGDVNGYNKIQYNSSSSIFSCYKNDQAAVYLYKLASGAIDYKVACCADPAEVTLSPSSQTVYKDIDGNATATIGFSQTGGTSGSWGTPTVTPSGPTVTKDGSNINFSHTATGTYTVGIGYTETCEKTGSATVTVAEQPIITATGTTTFSPTCGTPTAGSDITVNSRYLTGSTITASIVTSTGSGSFKISTTSGGTYSTTSQSITGGTTSKATSHIYVRYDPAADETGSIAGTLTLTCGDKTETVSLSGTVTCGCNIRFTSAANLVQITAANGIWVQANSELALSGSFLKTNANNANVSIRAYTNNAHFQLKTSGTTGEGAAKTSTSNALTLATNEGSNTANGWTGSLGVVYKPVAHNTTETATLTVEVYRYEGSTVYASTTYTLYGRSLPDNFVIAVNDGTKAAGHWYAIPADMIAPWGSNCTGLGTYKPYPITVNNNTNPTAVSGDAPARAIYTAAARTGAVNTNPQTLSFKSVALASSGNYYLYGSSSSETTIQNASNAESERQKWFLDVIDWANKKYNMRTDGNSNLLSYYISNVGVYSASGKKPDIYLLPVTTTCNNHLAPEGITCQGIDATNYTIRFTPDRTNNYEVSLNESSWSDVTTSVVTRCNDNDAYPKIIDAQIPLETYRGQTVYIRAKDNSGCPTSTTFAVPNPNVSVNSGTWMSMSGIAGSAFENTANSVTISGLASCGSQTVGVTCSNDKISASVNQSTGVVTISMTAGNATAGEHTGTLTFTLTGGTTRTQGISITLSTKATQEWDGGDETHFWEGMLCDEEGLVGDPVVYLSYQLYYNGSTVSDMSTFNSNSTVYLKDLNTNSNVTAHTMTRLNAGSGVFGVNLSYLTSYGDLTVGHRYRLAWENHSEDNSIQNAITNSSGLPYADCYMEFVYSQNCSAPTLGIECITNTTAQVSWGNTSASCSNYTLEWFQRTESSLTDYSIKDNTSNLQIWKYGNTVYESGNSYLNKWVVNDNNTSYKSANYGYQVGGSTVQNYIYTPRLNQLYASAGSGTMYEVTVTLYNGNTNSNAYAAKCFAVDNTSNGDYITTGYSATYNGASATNYVTPACPASSTQAYTFRVTGLTATSRIGFTCNTKGNKLYVKNVAVKRLEEGVHSSTTIAKSEDNYTITGLTAGKTYGATLTCGSSTSNEITLNTRSGTPLIYFKDGGSTITSYTFDETAVGESSSKTLNVTASKTGICDLNDLVRSLTGTGAGMFSVSVDFSTWNFYPLVGTYNGDITITYSPTSPGEHTATYTITDNGTSKTLTLNGTATGGQIEVVQWAPKGIIVESYVLDEGTPAVDSYDGVLQANGTYQIADAGWDLASQANEMIDIEWDETTESVRVPVMVTSSCNSSTLSSVTSTSDIVVMANKTLTINSSLTCHGLELYPTAKVVFSSGSLTADYVRLYCNGDTWANFPSFDASGASSISVDNAYVDFRIDESRFHFITLPFDVQTGDVVYAAPAANGANPPALRNSANNTAFYVRQYDGIARETNNKATEETYNTNMPHIGTAGGNYTMTAGRGYMIGIGDQASALGHAKRTLRFPIAMNSTKWTAEKGSSKVIGGSWVADGTDNSAARPVNKGWNLVGNPFMRELAVSSTSDKISTGHMVETDGNPRWTITEEDVRYITIYNAATDAFTYQSIASSFTLKPMAAFYMQMKDAKYINFQASMAGQAAASPIRRTNEQDEEVNVILNLSVGNISDKAGVVLYDYYDAAYNETDNADYPKLMSNSQLALWSIAGTEPLASNGLPKNTAKDIPLGYQAPKEGQYIFTLDINESNMNWLKHVWLTDLAQNVTCDLMLDSYNFSLTNAEKRTDRFLLNVELLSMDEVTTDIDSNIKNTDSYHPIKFIHEDKLYILHDGLIYDMTGKRVNVINK